MKKEHWLIIGSVVFSLLLGLVVIRWMAPQLFGMPADVKLVKLSNEYPSFFDTILRNQAEKESQDFLINDPISLVRGRPWVPDSGVLGPNDILGFRNYAVPLAAPIITIGDSQTYGNNVPLELNWPSQVLTELNLPSASLYNMSTGGWGAVQYLHMLGISSRFKPSVIIVAFYTGNDSLESFKAAYSIDKWKFLRLNSAASLESLPPVVFPAPESEWWKVQFKDAHSMVFTPRLRYYSNDPNSVAVKTGYAIIKESARIMDEVVKGGGVRLIFTILPTKELAYAKRIEKEGIAPTQDYKNLIAAEMQNIQDVEKYLGNLENSKYANVVDALQQAAITDSTLYPEDKDGHPLQGGYAVIGRTMAKTLSDLPKSPQGLVSVMENDKSYQLYLINQEGVWKVSSESILDQNGWGSANIPKEVEAQDLALYPQKGLLRIVDPKRFGPPNIIQH